MRRVWTRDDNCLELWEAADQIFRENAAREGADWLPSRDCAEYAWWGRRITKRTTVGEFVDYLAKETQAGLPNHYAAAFVIGIPLSEDIAETLFKVMGKDEMFCRQKRALTHG